MTYIVIWSHGTVFWITVQLRFHKMYGRWVSWVLSEGHKAKGMAYPLSFPQQYTSHCHDFLERLDTGEDAWVHHSIPEWKGASIEVIIPVSHEPENSRSCRLFCKVMGTVLLVVFLQLGAIVNVGCNTGKFTSSRSLWSSYTGDKRYVTPPW